MRSDVASLRHLAHVIARFDATTELLPQTLVSDTSLHSSQIGPTNPAYQHFQRVFIGKNNESGLRSHSACKASHTAKSIMARYLTPVQVCFLVLIDLYATGQVTSTTGSSFLSFLAHNIILYTSNEPSPAAGRNSLRSLENAQGLQRALSNIQSPLPGRTIYDVLLQRIWELDTPHNLQNFIGDTLRLLAGTTPKATTLCFSPWSPLGQYIRRCYVEMTRLHFTGILDLWKAFFTFRAPTFRTWAHRNPDAARQVHENEADEAFPPPSSAREGNGPLSSSSANEIDHLVNLEVQRLQQVGGRTSTELREHLQKCLSNATGDPALRYFIEYLDRCRAGQYTVALESLHRYFDYTLNASQGSAGPGSAKSYYQYALLHLSVLHAEFGNTEESRETLEECIAIGKLNASEAIVTQSRTSKMLLHCVYRLPATFETINKRFAHSNRS